MVDTPNLTLDEDATGSDIQFDDRTPSGPQEVTAPDGSGIVYR